MLAVASGQGLNRVEESGYIVLFITTATAGEAQQISKALLERRKVACVNIVPGVSSHFWWQDKLDEKEARIKELEAELEQLKAALPACSVCLKPLLPGNAEIGNPVTGVRIHASCEKGLR